jgi:hypothetical protein
MGRAWPFLYTLSEILGEEGGIRNHGFPKNWIDLWPAGVIGFDTLN